MAGREKIKKINGIMTRKRHVVLDWRACFQAWSGSRFNSNRKLGFTLVIMPMRFQVTHKRAMRFASFASAFTAIVLCGFLPICRAAVVKEVTVINNGSQIDFERQRRQVKSSSTVRYTTSTFSAVHRHVTVADVASFSQTASANYAFTVQIDVLAAPKELWQLDLDTLLRGSLLVRRDNIGIIDEGRASLNAFNISANLPNATVRNGDILNVSSLNLDTGDQRNDFDIAVNESDHAKIGGFGSQRLTFDVTWSSSAESRTHEASSRFGLRHVLENNGLFSNIGEHVEYANSAQSQNDGVFLEGDLLSAGRIFAMSLQGKASRIQTSDGQEMLVRPTTPAIGVAGLTLSQSKDVFGYETGRLFSIDPDTGQYFPRGFLNLLETENVKGIELIGSNPDQLYVLNEPTFQTQTIHQVDIAGNSVAKETLKFVGPFVAQKPNIIDLAYDSSNDILYGWDALTGLVKIDRFSGDVTDSIAFSPAAIDSIAFDNTGNVLYGLGASGLYSINTTTEQDILISSPNAFADFGDFVVLDGSFFLSNLIYNPGDGSVLFDPRGQLIESFDFLALTTQNMLSPGALVFEHASAVAAISESLLQVSGLNDGEVLALGPILPPNLSAEQLAVQFSFEYVSADGSRRTGTLVAQVIPEPSSLLLCLAGVFFLLHRSQST